MNDEALRARMKAYVMGWKETGEFLEAERRERVRRTDTPRELPAFNGIVLAALKRFPVPATSGLIEQQRLFMKLHARRAAA
jgi:hypothetical protein